MSIHLIFKKNNKIQYMYTIVKNMKSSRFYIKYHFLVNEHTKDKCQ